MYCPYLAQENWPKIGRLKKSFIKNLDLEIKI